MATDDRRAPLALDAGARRLSGPMLAFLLSLGWLGFVVLVLAVLTGRGQGPADALGLMVVALAVALPVVLIWLSVLVLRTVAALQAQTLRIEAAVDRLRRNAEAAAQAPPPALPPDPDPEAALALFVSRREAQRRHETGRPETGWHETGWPDAAGQAGLALDPPPPAAALLDGDSLIRALDFPRDARDASGFDLLRRALHDPGSAELIRAAQEVLSGLAAEGIETRDLNPDRARPEVWRAFAQGARGAAVAGLGGVRDRSVLALTGGRMRADPAFREAAHRFLRAFDRRLAAFEPEASDAQLVRLAETRSARAFMILGRVTGIFG